MKKKSELTTPTTTTPPEAPGRSHLKLRPVDIKPVTPPVRSGEMIIGPGKNTMTKLEEEFNRLQSQISAMTGLIDELNRAREMEQRLGALLGSHYRVEIAEGRHNGMTLIDIVIMYMLRERQVMGLSREMGMSWDRTMDQLQMIKEQRRREGV